MRRSSFVLSMLVLTLPLRAQEIARIGSSVVTHRDIEVRIAIERAYGGMMSNEAALATLVNDQLERGVAASLELLPDAAELERFVAFAERTSQAPAILNDVRRLFGADTIRYRQLYLAPRLVNMKLHAFFARDSASHASERASVEQAFALVARGMSLSAAAERTGLRHRIDSVALRSSMQPKRVTRRSSHDSLPRDRYATVLEQLEPHKLYRNVVETDSDFRVIRLLAASDSMRIVEAIVATKRSYDGWFRQQAASIDLIIHDPSLRRRLVTTYPSLWWLHRTISIPQ